MNLVSSSGLQKNARLQVGFIHTHSLKFPFSKKLTGEEMRANYSTQEMTDLGSKLLPPDKGLTNIPLFNCILLGYRNFGILLKLLS